MTAPFDLQETDRLLSTTRAVRRRLDLERPVEREVILDCIRLSQQAPTASNTQKWCWMVVMDPEKRKAIGEIYGRGKQFIEQAKAQIDAPPWGGSTPVSPRLVRKALYVLDRSLTWLLRRPTTTKRYWVSPIP